MKLTRRLSYTTSWWFDAQEDSQISSVRGMNVQDLESDSRNTPSLTVGLLSRMPRPTSMRTRLFFTPPAAPDEPKGAVHSQADIFYTNETYCREVFKLREGDRLFSSSRLPFAYGLGNCLTFPLLNGLHHHSSVARNRRQ